MSTHFALILIYRRRVGTFIILVPTMGLKRLVADRPYYPSLLKLRRYFDLKNFSDPFRVLKGVYEARRILRKLRPHLVFSKGGFVSVPVTIAAWSLRIPVVLHESDLTPGLANKLSLPFARELCLTFPDSLAYLKGKGKVTGTPIRSELTLGSKNRVF